MSRNRSGMSFQNKCIVFMMGAIGLLSLSLAIYYTPALQEFDFVGNNVIEMKDVDTTKENAAVVSNTPPVVVAATNVMSSSNTVSTATSTATSTSNYNYEEYQKLLEQSLTPKTNVSTAAHSKHFFSGLNNQVQRFMGVVFNALNEDFGQIIEESISWKDTFGHNDHVSHHMLWDVVHWNSFFPELPRFGRYEKELYPHLDLKIHNVTAEGKSSSPHIDTSATSIEGGNSIYPVRRVHYNVTWDIWMNRSITIPQPIIQRPQASVNRFKETSKSIQHENFHHSKIGLQNEKAFAMIHKGALKPHPFLQGIINRTRDELGAGEKGYMTLHARVEPDMARQDRICAQYKVWNLTEIIDMIYVKYPEPPVTTVLVQFSRALMESEAKSTRNEKDKFHIMNDYNLEKMNKLVQDGMWGGKVKVVEAGSAVVENAGHPFYKHYSNIAGGIVNLYLAIQSSIFVGSEISTYSVMASNMRFYRDMKDNFFYRPEGLYRVTPPDGKQKPFRFVC